MFTLRSLLRRSRAKKVAGNARRPPTSAKLWRVEVTTVTSANESEQASREG